MRRFYPSDMLLAPYSKCVGDALMSLNNKRYFAVQRKGLSILKGVCVFKGQCVKVSIVVK
jgi:hypothetical protein